MSKIVVVGNEDITLGFELVGIESTTMDKFEELISNKSDVGVVVISQEDYNTLSIEGFLGFYIVLKLYTFLNSL